MQNVSCNLNKGFTLTFENGLTISVQFGHGNYCGRRNTPNPDEVNSITTSFDAEIAIWNDRCIWYNFGGSEVKGWVNPDEIAKWIYVVSKATSLEDIDNLMNPSSSNI
jgi:hypothetical protein